MGAQQALDCLEFTLRFGGGACRAAEAHATEATGAARGGKARGAAAARAAAGGSSEVVRARCLADSSPSATATASAADGLRPLQLIIEGPASTPPRQYTVEIPDGVLPGGSFVAVLGGVAATVPVPADCELPPVTLALALAFATHPATPELALALALALTP